MQDVEYKEVWKCEKCDATVEFPVLVWDSWSDEQRQLFIDENERLHLVHPEE